MSGRTSSIAANMLWRLMDESKYTDGFIWSVGPVFNSSEKRLDPEPLLGRSRPAMFSCVGCAEDFERCHRSGHALPILQLSL